jgi:hypothetical protein
MPNSDIHTSVVDTMENNSRNPKVKAFTTKTSMLNIAQHDQRNAEIDNRTRKYVLDGLAHKNKQKHSILNMSKILKIYKSKGKMEVM